MSDTTTNKPRAKKRSLPVSPIHRRTISVELFQQWRELARKGDAELLAETIGVSKPTINKAIIYGCVHSDGLKDQITKFFADRLMKEREDADRLRALAAQAP